MIDERTGRVKGQASPISFFYFWSTMFVFGVLLIIGAQWLRDLVALFIMSAIGAVIAFFSGIATSCMFWQCFVVGHDYKNRDSLR
jgi:hypothetical protein